MTDEILEKCLELRKKQQSENNIRSFLAKYNLNEETTERYLRQSDNLYLNTLLYSNPNRGLSEKIQEFIKTIISILIILHVVPFFFGYFNYSLIMIILLFIIIKAISKDDIVGKRKSRMWKPK